MMHTSKMILVPSQMVHKETGTENLMSSLDKEMQRILEDKKLPSDAKVVQYMQILHRYQKTNEEYKKPFKIEVQEPVTSKKLTDEQILKGIPTKQKNDADTLLQYVKQNSHITWSDDNELIVDGIKFPGSNIRDLIHDFSRGKKTDLPVKGAEAFARTLAKSNVPKSVIGNKYRYELFEDIEPLMVATPANVTQSAAQKTKKSKTKRGKQDKAFPPIPFNKNWDSVY